HGRERGQIFGFWVWAGGKFCFPPLKISPWGFGSASGVGRGKNGVFPKSCGIMVALFPGAVIWDHKKERPMKISSRNIFGSVFAAALLLSAGPVLADPPFRIPPGHLPPPGMCRIWFPG